MNQKRSFAIQRLLAVLIALLLVAGLAGCGGGREEEPGSSQSSKGSSDTSKGSVDVPYVPEDFPDFEEKIAEMYEINDDTVGWLQVPGTSIDDVVVCNSDPNDLNEFYVRRDINKRYSWEGIYYADFRNKFDGSAEGLSRNTIIYGHSLDMDDNPDEILFSQLKKFLDEDFAKEHPYIYFSTAGSNLVWEVFSVFHTTVQFDYINPCDGNGPTADAHFEEMVKGARDRSVYNYSVDVTPEDKILTLSTCVYQFTPGQYPNDYRYVVMARLVTDDEYHEKANLVKNPEPKEP